MPALSALLEAYLAVGADQLVASNQLEPILGVFQKLLASKLSEAHAFDLLKSIILHVKYRSYSIHDISRCFKRNRDTVYSIGI